MLVVVVEHGPQPRPLARVEPFAGPIVDALSVDASLGCELGTAPIRVASSYVAATWFSPSGTIAAASATSAKSANPKGACRMTGVEQDQ